MAEEDADVRKPPVLLTPEPLSFLRKVLLFITSHLTEQPTLYDGKIRCLVVASHEEESRIIFTS